MPPSLQLQGYVLPSVTVPAWYRSVYTTAVILHWGGASREPCASLRNPLIN